ncbi:protein TANC2-like [Mytilus trossulus]|uniref:protein TANC2-like n=1 Tax=Mytilus trossulus TaxID=6551 RepID=UPI003006E41B
MIDRKWLLPILKSKLDQPNQGILLAADMGFGKSSIVSNIVCAQPNSVWHQLKKHVLAYHMCRYDVISSSKPDIFIKNLVGTIVKQIPELGNSILSDDRALDFLYGVRCREDPVGCLEFSLLNPLKNAWKERSFIIIIDAIDECQTTDGHSLQDLLYKRLQFFPNNVKFFITSRNIEQITNKFKTLETVFLDNHTLENHEDVRSYIDKTRKLSDKEVAKLTKVSGGNFLHVKLFLNYCIQKGSCDYDQIPDTLERIYVLNFERVFGKKGLFDNFVDMFAVLCSLQHPIDEDKLLEVSGMKTNTRVRARQILGNELGHFLKVSDGRLSFQHKSLADFLTNSSRKHLNFYIDIKRGHKLFAKFLLQSLNLTESNSLLEVVHHVALSKDVDFEVLLINQVRELNLGHNVIGTELLFNAVREYDSYDTVQLMIKLIRLNASNINEEQLSHSAFIAIANEHEESFRACLENGANISYIYEPIFRSATGDYTYICKYVYFCKYSLLHLTAQKGYLKIAESLLEKQISLLYLYNSLGLNAFQLAAEHGHTSIMELFLNYNSSLVDFYSLYLSAQHGEYRAVKLQLGYVGDVCRPCVLYPYMLNMYRSWVQYHSDVTSKTSGIKYQVTLHFESWYANLDNLFRCESALNAATRNGHVNIMKLLISKSNDTLNCPSLDGSFPLISAVANNRTELFKILYETGANKLQRCHNMQNLTYRYLMEDQTYFNISMTYLKQPCPHFGGVEHLVAIYDNLDIIHLTHEKGYHSWSSRDIDGVTPIHYAFCHNSINFLNYIVLGNRSPYPLSNLRSNNGSTPFHSAAICKSVALFYFFSPSKNSKYNIIPDVMDNENRSILQYAFLQPLQAEDLVKIDYIGYDSFTSSLLHALEVSNHNLLRRDIYGRNFLHYASLGGNYFAFVHAKDSKVIRSMFGDLLQQKDIYGKTTFELAFEAMSEHDLFEPFKMPNNCSLNDIFSSS